MALGRDIHTCQTLSSSPCILHQAPSILHAGQHQERSIQDTLCQAAPHWLGHGWQMRDSSPVPAAASLVRRKAQEEWDGVKGEPWMAWPCFGVQFCNFLHLVLGFFSSLLLLTTVTFSPACTLLCFACFLAIWVIEGCFSSQAKSARC